MRLSFVRSILLGFVLCLPACTETEAPEARLRALIESAEQAAESRQGRVLRSHISDAYVDVDGRDRRTVDGILRLVLLRHESIHLLTRISELGFPETGRATAVVYVAMAGRPIAGPAQLASLRASLYRFELDFADEDGEWRVVSAAWRRAEPADFVYPP